MFYFKNSKKNLDSSNSIRDFAVSINIGVHCSSHDGCAEISQAQLKTFLLVCCFNFSLKICNCNDWINMEKI